MKICFTTNSSPWSKYSGGAQIFIHNLAINLNNLGHSVTVLYTGPEPAEQNCYFDSAYKKKWAFYIGYPWTGKFRQLNSATVYHKLKEIHKKDNFDIINSIAGEALFIPKFCKLHGIPFCVSIEHPDLGKIKPHISLKNAWGSFLRIVRSRELWICKYISSRANFVFTPSLFTKNQAIRYFDITPQKINVVNHGIIAEMLHRNEKPMIRNIDGPIVFFGRLEPQKGVDILIKAFINLIKEKILINQELIIIGDGPYKKRYQKIVSDFKILNRVHFKGWKSPAFIKNILAEASLCILPSTSESFGLSIAETLSQGVPLITTSAGSIPEVVDFGRGAWLAKPCDLNSLICTIRKAIENYQESIRKAEYGEKFVRKKFTWEIAAQEYEKVYFEMLNYT